MAIGIETVFVDGGRNHSGVDKRQVASRHSRRHDQSGEHAQLQNPCSVSIVIFATEEGKEILEIDGRNDDSHDWEKDVFLADIRRFTVLWSRDKSS